MFDADELIRLFASTFADTGTVLRHASDGQPFYLAPRPGRAAEIRFAHGYFASALHEIAHWCIAGAHRRQQDDFGYWYEPDGRAGERQAAFEAVEAAPQAIEWSFHLAAGSRFHASADNLAGDATDAAAFLALVRRRALAYVEAGWPLFARRWQQALVARYGGVAVPRASDFLAAE